MDEQDLLLERLRAVLRAYDDEAFAALANKGLVRRARKDVERTAPRVIGAGKGRLKLSIEDCTVELSESVKDATCTCPAGAICRHILAALIHVKESGGAAPPAPAISCAPELLAVEDAALEKWAGKPLLRRALEALARGLVVEVEDSVPFLLRLPAFNITCRWMPGGGLEGMVCSCHSREACEHRVAGVLAYQVAQGKRKIDMVQAGLSEAAGAPRTREEVLASVGSVLTEMITLGFCRLSLSVEQRLRTLAVSAHGVDLPRLERLLRVLGDEVRLMLARDAQASSSSLMAAASRLEALRSALADPKPALIGQHWTVYDRVGDIQLAGMGARRWRTKSGHVGLTVYFWDRSAKDWASWSESRPETVTGFNPQGRYADLGPWAGCESPSLASRSLIRLVGAWRNAKGRLSGRASTRAVGLGPCDPLEAPTVSRWPELSDRAFRIFGGGLTERRENEDLVVLTPASWEPAQFDPVRQESTRIVRDADGRLLTLVLPHTPETAGAITLFDRADASALRGVLGGLRLREGRLVVEPIALYEKDRVVNLTLDAVTTVTMAAPTTEPVEPADGEDELEESSDVGHTATSIGLALTAIEGELEAIAESGLAAYRGGDDLRRLGLRADAMGLGACGRTTSRVVGLLERMRGGQADASPASEAVLRARYVIGLASDAESIVAATAELA